MRLSVETEKSNKKQEFAQMVVVARMGIRKMKANQLHPATGHQNITCMIRCSFEHYMQQDIIYWQINTNAQRTLNTMVWCVEYCIADVH